MLRDGKKAKALTTRQILLKYAKKDADGKVDATGMLSKECYQEWVSTRQVTPRVPHTAFRDAVKKVLIGSSRVTPFPPDVEAAVLELMREKVVWPCFAEIPNIGIGKRGWRVRGYHQRKMMEDSDQDYSEEDKDDGATSGTEQMTEPISHSEPMTAPNSRHGTDFKQYSTSGTFLTPELFSMIVRTNSASEKTKPGPKLVRKKMSSCDILRDAKIKSQALSGQKMQRRNSKVQTKEPVKRYDSHSSVDSHSILLSLLPQTSELGESHDESPCQQQSSINDLFDSAPIVPETASSTQHSQLVDLPFTDTAPLFPSQPKKPSLGQTKPGKSFATGVFSKSDGRRRGNTDFGPWGTNQARYHAGYKQGLGFNGVDFLGQNVQEQRRNSFPNESSKKGFQIPEWNSTKQYRPEVQEQRASQQQDFCTDWIEQHCTI